MFCTKCGNYNEDDAVFCSDCGTTFQNNENHAAVPSDRIPPKGKRSKIALFVTTIVCAILVFTALVLVRTADASSEIEPGVRTHTETIRELVTAFNSADAKALTELFPSDVIDALAHNEGIDREELTIVLQEELDEMKLSMDDTLGTNWKVSHKIVSRTDLEETDLLQLQELYNEVGVAVKDAKRIKLELTIESKDYTDTDFVELIVIKVDASWYLDIECLEAVF